MNKKEEKRKLKFKLQSISSKIFAFIFGIMGLVLILGMVAIITFSDLKKSFRVISFERVPEMYILSEIAIEVESAIAESMGFFMAENQFSRKTVELGIKDREYRIEELERTLRNITSDKEVAEKIIEARKKISENIDVLNNAVKMGIKINSKILTLKNKLIDFYHKNISSLSNSFHQSPEVFAFKNAVGDILINIMQVDLIINTEQLSRHLEISRKNLSLMKKSYDEHDEHRKIQEAFYKNLIIILGEDFKNFDIFIKKIEIQKEIKIAMGKNSALANTFDNSIFFTFKRSGHALSELNIKYDRYLNFTYIMMLAIISTFVTLIFYFRRKIKHTLINRLRNLQFSLEKNIEGNNIKIDTSGNDEITELAEGVEFFVQARNSAEKSLASKISQLQIKTETLELQEKEQIKLMNSLEIAKQKSEDASKAKSAFLANMSHELRTPLNAIIGFSEIMKEGMMGKIENSCYVDYIKLIHSSGSHLLNLINDVLDLAKVEAGKVVLKDEIVDIRELFDEVLSISLGYPGAKDLSISNEIICTNCSLFADKKMIGQIMLNMISNAIKFTPPENGKVLVSAYLTPNKEIVIAVKDNGVGVAKEEIPKILEPFMQSGEVLSKKHQGTGLGLSLVKSLIEAHGGYFTFDSDLGKGTTASISFPEKRTFSL